MIRCIAVSKAKMRKKIYLKSIYLSVIDGENVIIECSE